jgi:hypothetical protein
MTFMLLRLCSNGEQDEERDGWAHDGLHIEGTDHH